MPQKRPETVVLGMGWFASMLYAAVRCHLWKSVGGGLEFYGKRKVGNMAKGNNPHPTSIMVKKSKSSAACPKWPKKSCDFSEEFKEAIAMELTNFIVWEKVEHNIPLMPKKLFNSSFPQGNFGMKQPLESFIGLSLLYPRKQIQGRAWWYYQPPINLLFEQDGTLLRPFM